VRRAAATGDCRRRAVVVGSSSTAVRRSSIKWTPEVRPSAEKTAGAGWFAPVSLRLATGQLEPFALSLLPGGQSHNLAGPTGGSFTQIVGRTGIFADSTAL
jgi:hypothetical protein